MSTQSAQARKQLDKDSSQERTELQAAGAVARGRKLLSECPQSRHRARETKQGSARSLLGHRSVSLPSFPEVDSEPCFLFNHFWSCTAGLHHAGVQRKLRGSTPNRSVGNTLGLLPEPQGTQTATAAPQQAHTCPAVSHYHWYSCIPRP